MKQNRFKQRFLLSARTFALVLIPFSFCACFNWDNVHRTFPSHDCSLSPDECTPICVWDKKELEEQRIREEEDWQKYKNLAPYVPQKWGVDLIDKANAGFAEISARMVDEVVKPYVELDEKGYLCEYKTFLSQVKTRQEQQMERGNEISFEEAVVEIYSYWNDEYGEEKCEEFLDVLPWIENMQAGNQITEAVPGLLASAESILGTIEEGFNQLSVDWKRKKASGEDWMKRAEIVAAFAGTLAVCDQLIKGLIYMQVLDPDHAEEREKIESALAGISSEEKEQCFPKHNQGVP